MNIVVLKRHYDKKKIKKNTVIFIIIDRSHLFQIVMFSDVA